MMKALQPARHCLALGALLAWLSSPAAMAGIQVDATRVIYAGGDRSASLGLRNDASRPYMAQTWLDTGDKSKVPDNLPIVVTPPILKLQPHQQAILRFIYSGSGLPTDQETVLWVNVQEIPPTPARQNVLQIAIRTRVKLFYRPTAIADFTLDAAARKLRWQRQGDRLIVHNDSPLHVTFSQLLLKAHNAEHGVKLEAPMLGPHAQESIQLPAAAGNRLDVSYINDYGGHTDLHDIEVQ